jgi:hypothetical protein
MSYTINVNGHKDGLSEDEARQFEEQVRDKALSFVASLDGVTAASGVFGMIGAQSLKSEE